MNSVRPSLLLLSFLLLLLPLAGPSRAQEEPDPRFGVVEAYTARNTAQELAIGWTRVRFQWAETQAGGPDAWTPEVSEEQIAAQVAAGRDVVGLLIGIPGWARDEAGLPAGLWLDYDDPRNLWGVFVGEVARRYAGNIDHWIIWNEPDIDKSEIAHSWDGSVDDFYQLQRVAYLAAKAANPQAVIHLPAFTYWADVRAGREQYMARLLDRFLADPQAAPHNFYFDVATAHLYFQPGQIYELLGVFQTIMAERGLARPIWLVETNAPPYDDPAWPVDEPTLAVRGTEQAAFMPQALAAALAAGAERVGVYKMRDTEGDRAANPEPFGLLRLDGSRRLAASTLREAMRLMRGTMGATRERWDAVGQFRLLQADRVTTVLFSRLPQPQQAAVQAVAPTARLVDMWGQEQEIAAVDGRYEVELQQALCTQTIGDYCMIGGTVLYLIQALDGGDPPYDPPPLAPPWTPTPWPSPTATATPRPSATPQPAATPTSLPSPTARFEAPTAAATGAVLAGAAPTVTFAPQATALPAPPPSGAAQARPLGGDAYWFLLAGLLGVALLALLLLRRR